MTVLAAFHTPVLCHTVLELLVTAKDGVYVDATLGGGGHSAALLAALAPGARVIGIDCDAEAIEAARVRLQAASNFVALRGNFSSLPAMLETQGIRQVDGLVLDLGVSSHQLDHAQRGFSHRYGGALDMRMNQQTGTRAAVLINEWPPEALAKALFRWGEEPRARRITQAIVKARPITTTTALASIVRSAVPARHEAKTLARVFQAIRIGVNGELQELESVLKQAPDVVKVGGRFVVISYHSLEDRRVKRVMRHGNLAGEPIRDLYGRSLSPWRALLKKPATAGQDEMRHNPRARSAKLRAATRIRIPGSNTTT